MADNLSPLVNLDLVNQIYRTINAQISERVYDPNYYSAAKLGDANHRYVIAYLKALNVSGDATITGNITGVENISATTFNNLTLKANTTGFEVSGGTTSKKLTVADTTSINKPLTISANTTISANLTVSAATKIIKELTVGADNTGTVTIKSGGTGNTTIVGPNSETANLIKGTYTDSATTKNSTNPTNGYLLKIGEVGAGKFLAGPASGSGTADYRKIVASDLPEAGASASGIVTAGTQTFAGEKTFSETIKGSINGNAATADQVKTIKTDSNASYHVSFVGGNNTDATAETVYTNSKLTYNPFTGTLSATSFNGTADKTAHSLSITDGASTSAINSWDGSADATLTIKGDSPIAVAATNDTITITHDNSIVTAGTYKSVTVDAKGHVTDGTNPTTLDGYGITDAKIASGVVTLGSNTITPLTKDSSLAASKVSGTLATSNIPDLDASKITSGTISTERLPAITLAAGSGIQYLIGAPSQDGNIDTATTSGAYYNGSNLYAAGFYVSSLRSLKENIEPTKVKAVDLINSQEIVDFNYKADKDKAHKVGLIADDSDPLFLDKKGETVDLYNTCGILMKAVQELSAEVERLKSVVSK